MSEGETKHTALSSIKPGSYMLLDGVACRVTDIQISRPGKHGHAKTRIEAVGFLDNRKRQIVMPGHDNIEVPIVETKSAQVLTVHGNTANVMDSASYETFDLEIPDDLKGKVTECLSILYWEILNDRIMKQIKSE